MKVAPPGSEAPGTDTTVIQEGITRILIPEYRDFHGPGTRQMTVFYNPVMEFARDISVVVLGGLRSFERFRASRILDGLAGSGIKGLRFAKEIGNRGSGVGSRGGEVPLSVDINDRDMQAYALITKNIEYTGIDNAQALNENLLELLAKKSYDYIDIDPFGSPVPFFDAAVRALGRDGVLGLTATDTAVLCGSYSGTCRRRYGAKPLRCPFMHELAVRILIGFCVREAAKYDIAVRPLLVHASDHYIRAYIHCNRSATLADKALEQMGWGYYHMDSGSMGVQSEEEHDAFFQTASMNDPRAQWFGPLWLGALHDRSFIEGLNPGSLTLGCARRVGKFLALAHEEASAPPLYYVSSKCSKRFKLPTPQLESILKSLISRGHCATRTHFHPAGFKTSAGIADIEQVFRMIVEG